jgi:hypothetical protein
MRSLPHLVCLAIALALGCATELENPSAFNLGGNTSTAGGGSGGTSGGGSSGGGSGGTSGISGGGTGGTAGSGGTEACDAPTMVFQVDNDANPGQGCAGAICHVAANAATYPPDLVSPGVAARVKDVPSATTACGATYKYIDSANIEDSLLLTKLTAGPACGSPMPFPTGGLAQDKIECIRSWVTSIAASP